MCLAKNLDDSELKKKFEIAVTGFTPNNRIALRQIKLCKTEVMHSSDVVRFKISIPSDTALEDSIIDGIEKLENTKQWIGPRPAGYLEAEAQKLINNV